MIDLIDDIRSLNDSAAHAACTGMVILGGGIVKHHTCNANLMRNGAEYSVYINTGQVPSLSLLSLCLSLSLSLISLQEFDGSDSGASPDEAISWGKIKMNSKPVKICADATLVFPLIVSQTFYKEYERRKLSEVEADTETDTKA
jgi:deoxyhypusine synthase